MNTSKLLFRTGVAVLRNSHFVFQTLADASLEAEIALVERTGYYAKDGSHFQLGQEELQGYREARVDTTRARQQSMIKAMRTAGKLARVNK